MNIKSRELITFDIVRSIIDYNEKTGLFTWKSSYGTRKKGDVAGRLSKSKSGKSYLSICFMGHEFKAHRLAFLWMGESIPEQVDHDDGNGLNNKWSNLNASNQLKNSRNCRLKDNNSSGITGITFEKDKNLWRCRINVNKKRISLGRTKNFFEACCIRKSAEIKYGYHQNHGSIRPLY